MTINAKRIAQIKAQMQVEPKMKRQLGRAEEQVARNLYAMLADAEGKAISKKAIVHAALNTFDEGHAQKQLDELTVPPAVSASKLQGRLARLQKKPENYVKVAVAWASRMGRSADDALLRLFDGTEYGVEREIDEDDYNPAGLIAAQVRKIASAVAEKIDLKTFWDRP